MSDLTGVWIGVGVTAFMSAVSLASTWGVLKWRLGRAEENVQKLWERYDLCSSLQSDRYAELDKHLGKIDTVIEMLKEQQKELRQIKNGKNGKTEAKEP